MSLLKEMKKAGKPNFKRAQLWARIDADSNTKRFRIIYPNGKAEYTTEESMENLYTVDAYWSEPCWFNDYYVNKLCYTSEAKLRRMIRRMKAYDKDCGYRTVFLGNL